jgi:alpha-D-ribose 1-methylphosphonate 5-phosphate C-P lyase
MNSCLATAWPTAWPDVNEESSYVCNFCTRPAVYDAEAILDDGGERSVWLCGKCDRSKQILKNWEVICD